MRNGEAGYQPASPQAFGPEFVVPFDIGALQRMRGVNRVTRVFVIVLIPVAAVVGILILLAGRARPMFLLALVPAAGVVAWLAAWLVSRHKRSRVRRFAPEPAVAMLLSAGGVRLGTDGVTTVAAYPWEGIASLSVIADRYNRYLVVEPYPGTGPDDSPLIGLEELSQGILRGPRGPRFLVDSLALSLPEIDAAVRHYSGGRSGVRV